MSRLLNALQRGALVERALKSDPTVAVGYSGGNSFLRYGGTGKNWSAEVGDIHANGIIASCLGSILLKVGQALPIAGRQDPRAQTFVQSEKETLDALTVLHGSQFGAKTWIVQIASLSLYGMAYLVKVRDGNRVVAYVPFMKPQVKREVINGVLKYRITLHGGGNETKIYDAEDVIVLKYGIPDPRNPLEFISPVMAQLREICSENECTTFIAAILGNSGFPGAIMSPKLPVDSSLVKNWVAKVREAIKTYTKDKRGEPYVAPEPMDVTPIGFNASQMQVLEFDELTIGKLCASLNIDPMAAGLPSSNKTYSNYNEARKAMIEDAVLPLWKIVLDDITPHLYIDRIWVGAIGRMSLAVDKACYPETADDRFQVSEDLRNDFKAGLLTIGQWYAAKGYTESKLINDDRRWWDLVASSKPAAGSTLSRGRYSVEEHRRLELLNAESRN